MKAKIKRHDSFTNAINYIFSKEGSRCIGGTVTGDDPQEIKAEIILSSPPKRTQNPCWHCSLALPNSEKLDDQKWNKVVQSFFKELDIPDNKAYTIVRHNDTKYDHIHIVLNRVGIDGRVWHGQNDVYKAIEATQKLEKEFGLTITAGLKSGKRSKRLSREEIEYTSRKGILSKSHIKNAIDLVLEEKRTISFKNFCKELKKAGVTCHMVKSGDRIRGLRFLHDNITIKGSTLGKDYSWNSLLRKGVYYDISDKEKASTKENKKQQRGGKKNYTGRKRRKKERAIAVEAEKTNQEDLEKLIEQRLQEEEEEQKQKSRITKNKSNRER